MHSEQKPHDQAREGSESRGLDPIERELTASLCRVSAPDGFADRVMQRVSARPVVRIWGAWPAWTRAMAAVLFIAIPVTLQQWREHERTEEARRAEEQFASAMRITHAALVHAGQHLDRHSAAAERGFNDPPGSLKN